MRKISLFLSIISFLIFAFACNNNSRKNEKGKMTQATHSSAVGDSIIYPSESDTIRLNIVNGKGHLKIYKKERESIILAFNSQNYSKMTGHISTADSLGNVRFSTITMPDDEQDGPFGRDISYNLSQKGDYILSIHESLMAGDPWGGVLDVMVSLSK